MDYKNIFELTIKHLDEGVIIVDSQLNIQYFNDSSTNITGFDSKDAAGKNLFDIFPSLDRGNSTFCKVMSTRKPIVNHIQNYINHKGRNVTVVATTIPIINGEKISGAIEIYKDLTQVVELSEKVFKLQETLYSRNIKVGKFFENGTQYTIEDIIGDSSSIKMLKKKMLKVSSSDSPVFVYGETGTGKELVVHSLHNLSNRKDKPFIAQNCGALPENLLESILFGTVKGSFTGAADKKGLFEMADGGTLFLDELNSMSLELQAKLLRVIEDGVIRRLGDTQTKVVDVRIIAACNEEPLKLVKDGKLRRDLYYRLNVIFFYIPSLRERKEDISILVNHFINLYNKKMGLSVKGVDKEVLSYFYNYDWPGNIRELQNTIESAMNFVEGDYITKKDLQNNDFAFIDEITDNSGERIQKDELGFKEMVEEYERQIITTALKDAGQNCAKAARKLKMPKQTLHGKIKKYGI